MGAQPAIAVPTASDLLTRGLFHDRIIPPLSAQALLPAMEDILAFATQDIAGSNNFRSAPQRSKCSKHSVPKRKLARRILAIPNPRNQALLAQEVEQHWADLMALCNRSQISLTRPQVSATRALQGQFDRRAEAAQRAQRSIGQRYVLHADFARFYPSIYTHSISWAIHGKAVARADRVNALFGNRLDLWVRETQDKQTGGIPIGPDTSYLIAEVIASSIDSGLAAAIGELHGTRYIDDYHLYFRSMAGAERALAELHRVAGEYELDINDLKTDISELPDPLEPYWKTQLRGIQLRDDDRGTTLQTLFDRAAELAKQSPEDNVHTYVVKKVEASLRTLRLEDNEWEILDALLLRVAVGEPAALPTILRILETYDRRPNGIEFALQTICTQHAELQHASEVAWALWTAKRLTIPLPVECANAASTLDDDIVALVTLEMRNDNLLPEPATGFQLWADHMTSENLYLDHWLLAYEAYEHGWLPSRDGRDYIIGDPYFGILRAHNVRFYDTTADVPEPDSGYLDDFDTDEAEDDEEEDDDDSDDEEANGG